MDSDFRDAYEVLSLAVANFLHGEPCDNDMCREQGMCGRCAGQLEDAEYEARGQLRHCRRCGLLATGEAFVNDSRLCHGEGRHCYEEAQSDLVASMSGLEATLREARR